MTKLFSVVLPYVLLVSFHTPPFSGFGPKGLNAITGAGYDGVAVPLTGAYDTNRYSYETFAGRVKALNAGSRKDVWPWVFFNRFIGYDEGGRSLSKDSQHIYFRSIKGMDLYDEWGALGDFYDIWRASLKIAKELGSPGIVLDPEAYNNYDAYRVSYVAGELGKSEKEVMERLTEIGRELGRMAGEIYPDAVIWLLFSGFASPIKGPNPLAEKEQFTVTYIIEGMLEYAEKNAPKMVVVSGGEASLGYCAKSLEDLRERIAKRGEKFEKPLEEYPNLKLGGTISPWGGGAAKTGWMTKGVCGKSSLKRASDFAPLVAELKKSYGYVWIYAAAAAGYDPYDVKKSAPFNTMLRETANEN